MKKLNAAQAARSFGVGASLALTLAIGQTAIAQQASDKAQHAAEIGASERVNYSGKLRMLSQRVVATSCTFAAGIDVDNSHPAMDAAREEFETIIHALEHGDPSLGINGAEKRRKTIARIGELNALWAVMSDELANVDESHESQALIAHLAEESGPLLEMAKLLVVDLSAQYSDPNALLQSHAMVVDISGRQRMLAQRMSKNVCLIASGLHVDSATAELAKTAEIFEVSLMALRSGMPSAGIIAPPNPGIAEGLDVVIADWTALKPFVTASLEGAKLDSEDRAAVFHAMNRMTGNMNKVVGLYSDASKQRSW